MTDQERAERVVGLPLAAELARDANRPAIVTDLVLQFEAVIREDERRAIVASLVKAYGDSCRLTGGLFSGEAFLRAVESIERGEHVAGGQS